MNFDTDRGPTSRSATRARPRRVAALVVLAIQTVPLALGGSLSWGPAGAGGSGDWDVGTTANWFDGSGAVPWPAPGGLDDDAVFASTAGTVSIAADGVFANDLTFGSSGYALQSGPLTLHGTSPSVTTAANVDARIDAVIQGSAGLRKLGAGRLILTRSNRFTGSVVLGDSGGGTVAGILRVAHSGALGTGDKTVFSRNPSSGLELDGTGGGLVLPGSTGFITSGPAIRNVAGDNIIQGAIQMNTGAGDTTIRCDGGSLALNGRISAGTSARTLILSGNSTGTSTVNGPIANGGSASSVRKSGSGSWRIAHPNNSYSGPTQVDAGKLVLAGNLQSAHLSVAANARLAVDGAPATAGAFTLSSGAVLEVRAMPSQADRLSVGGAVTLAGSLELVVSPGSSGGGSFVILNQRGSAPISGSFAGLPEGATFGAGGLTWRISYTGGDGNDVMLVREPSALQSFDQRRDQILGALRGKPFVQGYISPDPAYRRPESYTYLDFALRCFLNDDQLPEANAAVAAFRNQYADNQYFDNVDWLSDLAFRILEDYGSRGRIAPGKLSQANEDALFDLFWQYAKRHSDLARVAATPANVWTAVGGTENLIAMNVATLWHAAKLLRHHPAYAGLSYDNGITPETYYQAGTAYYKEWLRERARKGMLTEFSNNHYGPVTIKGVYNFVDYSEDFELRELARKWLDLFWITWAQEQIHAVKGGGMARIYLDDWGKYMSMEGLTNPLSEIFWCYTGLGRAAVPNNNLLTYLASSYRPPAVMVDLATDLVGRGSYASVERKMGRAINGTQQIDLNETFTRYSYVTPDYILGTFHVGNWRYWLWQMISSQNRWHGAIFNSHPDARIFFQCGVTPSGGLHYNQHWSVQSRNAIIVHKLNNNGTESTRFAKYAGEMKVWVASSGRTELLERGGWVFASYGSAYAAIRVVDGGFGWRDDEAPSYPGRWMVLEKEYSPVVMEVGRAVDFASFTAFQDQILANPLTFAASTVNYRSTPGDTLTLDSNYSQPPRVNGVTLNFKPTKAYDSPFVSGDFGSGLVNVQKGGRQMTLDFNEQLPASFTWSAGSEVWDTSTRNWNNGTTPWPNTSGATAVFDGPAAAVILTPGLYPAGFVFNTPTVLSGAPLELAGLQTPFHSAAGITARVEAPVHGRAGLAKTGPGTLVLTGDNPLGGISRIDEGILQVGDGGGSGSLAGGPILNHALLSVRRSGTVEFPFSINGGGGIRIDNPTAADTVVLAGANAFTGHLALDRGTLRLAHRSALGGGARSLVVDGVQRIVQLGGSAPVVLPAAISFTASGSGLFNLAGDNRINGGIQMGDAPVTAIASLAGSLHLAGAIAGGTSPRTLELTGSSSGDNVVSGLVSDGVQPTSLLKSGSGSWRIAGMQSYTGSTSVNDGTLVLAGGLSGSAYVTGGRLAVGGGAAIAGDLAIAANGSFQARPDGGLDVDGSVTLEGGLLVDFPRGILLGSSFTLIRKNSAGPVAGTFAGLPEFQVFNAAGYSWRIRYTGGDGNDVVLTSLSGPAGAIEAWRDVNFGVWTDTGVAADSADPDGDGITNAQEYALGSDPRSPLDPSSFVWTQSAGGNWTTPANWNTNFAPPGNASRRLEFFADLTLPGGSTATTNNFAGTYVLHRLRLAGDSPTSHAVGLSGGAFDFRSAAGNAPAIVLATGAAPVSYTISKPVTLSADLTIDAMGGGQAVLGGALSGPGGITFTGTGTNLVLAGGNSYQGTTRILAGLLPGTITGFAGTLQIGNGGSTGSPGSGPIVNDGTLAFRRTGTLQVPNLISGSGRLLLNMPNAGDTVRLSGDNRFTGGITITRGRLVVTRDSALGSGAKSVTATSGNGRLELEGGSSGITLDSDVSLTLSGTELRNASGDNIVRGTISAANGAGGSTIASHGGSLHLAGTLRTANTGGRTVTLGGTSTAANTISGQIIDGVSTLTLQKSGAGSWILAHPDNRYTGPTAILAGRLVLTGSLTSAITTHGAIFAPQGSPATTGSLTQTAASSYQVRVTPGGADRLSVGGAVILDGALELLPSAGLAAGDRFIILNNTGSAPVAGTFSGLPEGGTFASGIHQWRISYAGGDGNDVSLSLVAVDAAADWRQLHFGSSANSGAGADSADANGDGENNLLEFATGQDPRAPGRVVPSLLASDEVIEFTYRRSRAAVQAGYRFTIEHGETLAEPWTSVGAGMLVVDGPVQVVSAAIPKGGAKRRFVRLRVEAP